MIKLTDSEMEAILQAARPIPAHMRRGFLVAVADQLGQLGPVRGPGSSHRIIKMLAKSYFDPPLGDPDGDSSSPGISRPLRPAR
jgi:hypothetical protein